MEVLCKIINLLAPIVNFLGVFGFLKAIVDENWTMLVVALLLAVIGAIFGNRAYNLDIPPRWTWSDSAPEYFSFRITAVIGYSLSIASYPPAIYAITILKDLIEEVW